MLYITDIHALNLPCELETTGDWHIGAIQWENPHIKESEGSLFGDYGIEKEKQIPDHNEKYPVANHIRALLDIIEDGRFTVAQGMNNDFICNEKYDHEIFKHVAMMQSLKHWDKIYNFMKKEYGPKWINFAKEMGFYERTNEKNLENFKRLIDSINNNWDEFTTEMKQYLAYSVGSVNEGAVCAALIENEDKTINPTEIINAFLELCNKLNIRTNIKNLYNLYAENVQYKDLELEL